MDTRLARLGFRVGTSVTEMRSVRYDYGWRGAAEESILSAVELLTRSLTLGRHSEEAATTGNDFFGVAKTVSRSVATCRALARSTMWQVWSREQGDPAIFSLRRPEELGTESCLSARASEPGPREHFWTNGSCAGRQGGTSGLKHRGPRLNCMGWVSVLGRDHFIE